MEIIFLLISIIATVITTYLLARTVHSHSELIAAYKRSEMLVYFHLFMGAMLTLLLFITLCACNNTFWHFPYYFK